MLDNIKTVIHQSDWSYSTYLVDNYIEEINLINESIGIKKALIITTPTVLKLYGNLLYKTLLENKIDIQIIKLEINEQSKTLESAAILCSKIKDLGLDRRSLLIGLGGGVCTDIVTVVASWIKRGIKYIRIPTTLIGQVDASIGIKGSLNFGGSKSFLGCFYPPEKVIIDIRFLKSLPKQHLRFGFSEIFKMALVSSEYLFDLTSKYASKLILTNFQDFYTQARSIITLSIKNMLVELEKNFYEDKSQERIVDMGHTFSPLLETLSKFNISHGEAVAIDMSLTSVISYLIGILTEEECYKILESLYLIQLPLTSKILTVDLCDLALREAERNRGCLNLVTVSGIGKASFIRNRNELSISLLKKAVETLNTMEIYISSRNINNINNKTK